MNQYTKEIHKETLREPLENKYNTETFEDIKKNDGLYYKSFMEGLFDGSIKQTLTYEEMMGRMEVSTKQEMIAEAFDDDFYYDFDAIEEHYANLIKGKIKYEKLQKETNKNKTK